MPFFSIDIVTLLTTIFWVWMLVDCVLSKRIRGGSKLCWFLLILFTHIVGAIIYYFVACEHRNLFEGLNSYTRRVTQLFQQGTIPPPTPQRPKRQTPPPSYTDYQQGYQAQRQESSPVAQGSNPQPYYTPPQYEQPTASYPEMPQQQQ